MFLLAKQWQTHMSSCARSSPGKDVTDKLSVY
uniref:Uncharacterized protein n=1 Tax=Anguilla anguilla TaxID=7936 RepID=A0A0E9TCE1_ANGAN